MKKFKFIATSLEGLLIEVETEKVICQTSEGQIGIFYNHVPLVAVLQSESMLRYEDKGKEETLRVVGGILEVQFEKVLGKDGEERLGPNPGNKVVILADSMEFTKEKEIGTESPNLGKVKELV